MSLLHTEQAPSSQPVSQGQVLQHSVLNCIQWISGFLVLESPKLHALFQILSNKHWVELNYHVSVPLLKQSRIWLVVFASRKVAGLYPSGCPLGFPSPSQQSCPPASLCPAHTIAKVIPSQVQEFPFFLAEFNEIVFDLFLQPAQVACTSSPALKCINCFLVFAVTGKLDESVLHHPSRSW